MSMRLDHALVEKGLISTRSQAQQLIRDGHISINSKIVTKSSFRVNESDLIEVMKEDLWVGRGAEKLAGAHEDFELKFEGKTVADMGASTGGFVEYALHHGAEKVFAIDVGHDQLAQKLKVDPRVINKEGTNIKDGVGLDGECDLVVVDLSFISLRLVVGPILACLKSGGEFAMLVKPQFEVGPEFLGKRGLVKDQTAIESSLKAIEDCLSDNGAKVLKKAPCRVKGNKSGNQEYFFFGKKL